MFVGPAQPFDMIERQIDLYRQTLDEHGHPEPKDIAIIREFYCAPNKNEALEKASKGFEKKYEVYASHGFHGTDSVLTTKITGDLETLMEDTFIFGSPDDCIKEIARYRELGITQIALRLFYPDMSQKETLKHIELVGREVLPEVHKL